MSDEPKRPRKRRKSQTALQQARVLIECAKVVAIAGDAVKAASEAVAGCAARNVQGFGQ